MGVTYKNKWWKVNKNNSVFIDNEWNKVPQNSQNNKATETEYAFHTA